jgi:hypothetical protein
LSCRVWAILKFSSSTEVFEFFYGGLSYQLLIVALTGENCCAHKLP